MGFLYPRPRKGENDRCISQGSPQKQIEYKEICYSNGSHSCGQKFHDPLSVSWRARKARGTIHPKSEGLRKVGERGSLMQVPELKDLRTRGREAVSPSSRREWGVHASSALPVLSEPSKD